MNTKPSSLKQRLAVTTICVASILCAMANNESYSSDLTEKPEAACGNIGLAYYELGALFYRTNEGVYAGIDKDVVEEIARRTGCHFNTVIESRVRIWTQLSTDALDMSVSGIATPEREKFARFIPYFVTRNYALLNKDIPAAAQTMDGFLADPSLQIAVVKSFRHGGAYDDWLNKLRAQKRLHEAADFDTVMRLLVGHRVNAALALPVIFQPYLMQNKWADSILIKDWAPADRVVHGLIVSRARVSQSNFDLLEKTIRAMRDDGSLDKIFKRHIGAELAKEIRLEQHKP